MASKEGSSWHSVGEIINHISMFIGLSVLAYMIISASASFCCNLTCCKRRQSKERDGCDIWFGDGCASTGDADDDDFSIGDFDI